VNFKKLPKFSVSFVANILEMLDVYNIRLRFIECLRLSYGISLKVFCILLGVSFFSTVSLAEGKLPFKIPKNYATLPQTAEIITNKGSLVIKFYRKEAPISVANFEHLVKKKVYENLLFHRYTPGFVIQGGDPTNTGKGGPGWKIPPELSTKIKHKVGTLGWASLPAEVNPERLSNGSQFYIMLRDAPDLDRYYTAFAQVVRGMKTLEQLRRGDKILKITLNPKIHKSIEPKLPVSNEIDLKEDVLEKKIEEQGLDDTVLDRPIELNREIIQEQRSLREIIKNKNEQRQ